MQTRFLRHIASSRFWFEEYEELYIHAPPDALVPVELDYFGHIHERASWESGDQWPTDEEVSYGVIRAPDFLRWLRTKRVAAPPM